MGHRTMIGGTLYDVAGGRTMVNGTIYDIAKGRTMIGGSGYDISFEVPLASLPVGSSIYLNEVGIPIEYLIIHQGLPSDIYDSSCDGTWLLRKDIRENRAWNSESSNDYANSDIHTYLNSTFLALLDPEVQDAIKQAKVPYRAGSGISNTVASGENGLLAKVFLLSMAEVGISHPYSPVEGTRLNYFDSDAANRRTGKLDGTPAAWWLRSPYIYNAYDYDAWYVFVNGYYGDSYSYNLRGLRPALILPSDICLPSDCIAA